MNDLDHKFCPHHGETENHCSGCPWMSIPYSEQFQRKQEAVIKSLSSLKSFTDETKVNLIQSSPSTLGYRNRCSLKTNGVKLGYVNQKSKQLVDIQNCPILNQSLQKLFKNLRKTLPNTSWKPKAGKDWINLELDDSITDTSKVSPQNRLKFRQGNTEQNEFMKTWIRNELTDVNDMKLIELFCGSGNFTKILSQMNFTSIHAYESDSQAVFELKRASLPSVQAQELNLYDEKSLKKMISQVPHADVLLLDPPRTGFSQLSFFVKNQPKLKSIFYVSCDLKNMAKDLQNIHEHGFQISKVQPIDMFPHTPHVETLIRLDR
jgi:23S rRNA (uracil1939-C5)-methyltransferase